MDTPNLTPRQQRIFDLAEQKKKQRLMFPQTVSLSAEQEQARTMFFNTVEELYAALNLQDHATQASFILDIRHWLTAITEFDPATGYALPTDLLTLAHRIAFEHQSQPVQDRVYHLIQHVDQALRHLIHQMRKHIVREHALVPIHAAREVDSSSIQWLSRKSGRTLREKLSGKPYIKAVQRRSSLDSAENRLLKAFVLKFEQLILSRNELCSNGAEEELGDLALQLQHWIRSGDIQDISVWKNLPPNNALLQDKYYRKIWDGWLSLQYLDEKIVHDQENIDTHIATILYWRIVLLLEQNGIRIPQQPVAIDYDEFGIETPKEIEGYIIHEIFKKNTGTIYNVIKNKEFGFIIDRFGRKLFFHQNGLQKNTKISDFAIGDLVTFNVRSGAKGEEAFEIERPSQQAMHRQVKLSLDGAKIHLKLQEKEIFFDIRSQIVNLDSTKKHVLKNIYFHRAINDCLLFLGVDKSFQTHNTTSNYKYDSVIIDMFALRPSIFGNNIVRTLPLSLVCQYWGMSEYVDCGQAKAFYLNDNIQTFSMSNIFLERDGGDRLKQNALKKLMESISHNIEAERLTYLVPDVLNDFILEGFRKNINFFYPNSIALPQSIAAVFSWFKMESEAKSNLRENDFIFVLDYDVDFFSVTPVQVKFNEKLKKKLPPSLGFYWERHPTLLHHHEKYRQQCMSLLAATGFQHSSELLDILGVDGLINAAGQISIIDGFDQWYHLPDHIKYAFEPDIVWDAIIDAATKTHGQKSDREIFLLPSKRSFKKTHQKSFVWLDTSKAVLEGASLLEQWQQQVDDIPLWRDHLPELSIKALRNGRFETFFLVKDITIIPKRNKTIRVPISERFTLPAGQKHYNFPLFQGDGSRNLKFEAYLKSPAFPLKEDVLCELKMLYRYGEEKPYELTFIPVNPQQAGFKSVVVEWRTQSDIATENLPVPEFPVIKSVSELQSFPKKDSKEHKDMLEWVKNEFGKMTALGDFMQTGTSETRFCIELENVVWKKDKNQKNYAIVDWNGSNLFINQNNYEEGTFDISLSCISFDQSFYNERYSAKYITIGHSLHKDTCKLLKRSARFPILTVWGQGRSISDFPIEIQQSVQNSKDAIGALIEMEEVDYLLKEEIFFLLSALHQDAPDWVVRKLCDPDLIKKPILNIAFAIGTGNLKWQQSLLLQLAEPTEVNNLFKRLEILSIALWRADHLLEKIPAESIKYISDILPKRLRQNISSIERSDSNKQRFAMQSMLRNLELLLALIRTRGLEDPEKKEIFNPNTTRVKAYISCIDEIEEHLVVQKKLTIKSRIDLKIDKPEDLSNTPDLLYALKMYLNGEVGANAIKITGVTDEE